MKKLALIFLLPFVGNVFGQVEDVRITADGTVINTKTVKFATGKLMVNGVAVVGGPAGVTSVSGTAPIVSSGGLTPAISITAATTGAPGSMSAADKAKLDGIAAGAQPGTVTSVTVTGANGVMVLGSPITTSGTISLSLGAITPTSVAASGAVSGTNLSGTNTGDQTSIVGITGTLAQFNTALTGADFASGGGTATGTNTGDQVVPVETTSTASNWFSAYNATTGAFTKSQPAFSDLSGQIALAQITNGLITQAKLANMATDSLYYRKTAGSGAPEVNSLATLKTDLLLTGINSGDQTITLTGDVTGSGTGSFAATIGATKVTSAMLNADVFSTAHSWGGTQIFTAPVLGTPASGVATNLTGTASGLTAGTATALATARTINDISFNGTANITVPAGIVSSGTFAGAPASPVEGMLYVVTDIVNPPAWGDIISSGGGFEHALVYFNGSNWTVAAK